jgi:hypothetical protein
MRSDRGCAQYVGAAAAGRCHAAWSEALRDLGGAEILHVAEPEFRQSCKQLSGIEVAPDGFAPRARRSPRARRAGRLRRSKRSD